MTMSNRNRIQTGLDHTKEGLIPFVERELKSRLGGDWIDDITNRSRSIRRDGDGIYWDVQAILKAMVNNWHGVFRNVLGPGELSYVGELLEVRNKWAHENPFTSADVYRALDTMQRLLQSVSASDSAEKLDGLRADLQKEVYEEQAHNKTRYQQMTLDGTSRAGLKPWREVITPHTDVASGKYMQAEFAADLAQVHQGRGSEEYLDPHEFYRRTYITVGLRDLLVGSLQRMNDSGGDPVLELQTNFGGGKTHSMLALYHIFSGVKTSSLAGIEPVLAGAGVDVAPKANRAVLVGTALSPGDVSGKSDGTEVKTLWGEMAWQLGGAEGYAMVAEPDRNGTSPGSETLSKLFRKYSPCLILIDEWVAYARQLFDKTDLPAGDFGSQTSFAQALTEAAKAAPQTLVVASIPQSQIEIGGDNGQKTLDALKNIFSRVAKTWRAATGDEGFEIVRRRLFEPLSGADAFVARDATINAFIRMYRDNDKDFPRNCGERKYREEIRSSYPIHPELFRRLYEDWSTLDKFQRTRGVLRLLAKVIHRLWVTQDSGLLIMPSSTPMDDHAVKSELTRYLPDVWEPIISQDVDGLNSLPLAIDQEVRNMGRYSACRRVARALYIGTAPGADSTTPGVGSERIRLACAQPGETVAIFGDALRRVTERGHYSHQDGNRYWLSTRPNLNRTAEDRAADLRREPEELYAEIVKRLKNDRSRGEFAGTHVCPQNTGDVPDDPEARLVILRPEHTHKRNQNESAGRKATDEFLSKRGTTPRLNRNCLVFVAPDEKSLKGLMAATAQYLAWTSILKDKKRLNLDQFQLGQAETKEDEFNRTIDLRIAETWVHALVPCQSGPVAAVSWEETRISGNGSLAERTGKKLVRDELLLPEMGGVRLRMTLDNHLWKSRDHVTVAELSEWFPRFLYLDRIVGRETLIGAIRNGANVLISGDTFALAQAYDDATGSYLGLTETVGGGFAFDSGTCIVKIDVARKQPMAEPTRVILPGEEARSGPSTPPDIPLTLSTPPSPPKEKFPSTFIGSVKLNGDRVGRDAGRIAEEVLSHLAALPAAEVSVTMEIQVKVPGGVNRDVVQRVNENAKTLKFQHSGFEDE